MNMHLPSAPPKNTSAKGMARFFSQTNLGRYRRLADDEIDAAERSRVLKMLATEWGAFMLECRRPSLDRLRLFRKTFSFEHRTQGDVRSTRNP
jgi:hypothetical protein